MENDHSFLKRRENISPGARTIAREGVPETSIKNDPLLQEDLTHDEAHKIFFEHAKEAFQITAVVSEWLIKKALEDRDSFPPYGLIRPRYGATFACEPVTELTNLKDMRWAMKQSLSAEQFLLYLRIKEKERNDPADRMAAVYRRYEKLYNFAQDYIKRPFSSVLDLEAGINTASNTMAWILEDILKVYERQFPGRELSIDQFIEIADNSWPLLAQNASLHVHSFSSRSFDPKYLELDSVGASYRLRYTKEAEEVFAKNDAAREIPEKDKRPAYGCPAMVNFGDGSAIKKLWNFHIDIAKKMYEKNYAGGSVFKLLSGR